MAPTGLLGLVAAAVMLLLPAGTARAFAVPPRASPTHPRTTYISPYISPPSPPSGEGLAATRRKPMSEWTEEEKRANRESGEKLLKVKGGAFLLAAAVWYLLQQQ